MSRWPAPVLIAAAASARSAAARVSVAIGDAVGGIFNQAAAVLVAQVVVVLALRLHPLRLVIAARVVRAGGTGQLGRPLPLVAVALEVDGIRGGAPDRFDMRLHLRLAAAL